MHRITEIRIHNFRSCANVILPVSDFTPLVGYNNAGKSNIIRALEWLVSPKSLQASDFNNQDQPISVEAIIEGIDENVLDGLGRHRDRFEPHVDRDGSIRVRTIQPTPGCSVRAINKEAWITREGEEGWHNPAGIKESLDALFPDVIPVPAMEDASVDLSKNQKSTTIGKLIAEIMEPLQAEQGAAIQEALDRVGAMLADDGEDRAAALRLFDDEATRAVQDFFPDIRVKIEVPPPDIATVFKTGKVKMADSRDGDAPQWRDVASHGHGAQRATHMALIKMLADRGVGAGPGRKLLLIDEPELYMHPQMIEHVRLALKTLSRGAFQVVFSTHSPLFVGREEMPQSVMVRKEGGLTVVRRTVSNCCHILERRENQVQTLLDLSNSSQLLFCDNAILAEGKTERELLPILIEEILDTTLLAENTAMVVLDGCSGFPGSCEVLSSLGFSQKVIADLDFAFTGGVRMGIWETNSPLYVESVRVLSGLAPVEGFELAENGLPKNGGEKDAEAGYNALATSEEGQPLVERIHNLFRENGIWVWPQGSIEYHLGMLGKGGEAIRQFRNELLGSGNPVEETVADYGGVRTALEWAIQQ